jgi:hemoglobin
MPIEDKAPSETPFEWIGGESRVRALVDRFYDLMDLEPAYVDLRAAHGPELANARVHVLVWLARWS